MQFKGRETDPWGNVIFDTDGLIDHLMRGHDLDGDMMARPVPGVLSYNQLCKELDHPDDQVGMYSPPNVTVADWDATYQDNWFTPEPWASMDVREWLLEQCSTEAQVQRILDEWELFSERDMIPVLRFLLYMVDTFRQNDVVWGVGRGSSVASYALYLMGVHKVDSLAFDLDIHEFLK
jgi:DNA polymerase III alpha subunit